MSDYSLKTLKVGCVFFLKQVRKTESGPVAKQTSSQSAVRGVSTHDVRRERSVHTIDISRAERQHKDRDGG